MKIRSLIALLLVSGLALGGCTNTAPKETNATITVKEHIKGRNKLDMAERTMYLNDPILMDWQSKSNADYQLSFEYIEKIDGVIQRQELANFPVKEGKQHQIVGFDAGEIIEDDGTTNFVYKIIFGTLGKDTWDSSEKEGIISMDGFNLQNTGMATQQTNGDLIGEIGVGDIKALYVKQAVKNSKPGEADPAYITSIEDIIDSESDYVQAVFLRVEESSTELSDATVTQTPTVTPKNTETAGPSVSPTASQQPSESPSPSPSMSADSSTSISPAVTQK